VRVPRSPDLFSWLLGLAVVIIATIVTLALLGWAWLWPVLVPVVVCVLGLLLLSRADKL
jgi:hypothetical protein